MTVVGTVLLCSGMALCAHLVESKTAERMYQRTSLTDSTRPSRLLWVQPGNQNVGDQIFDPFAYSDSTSPLQRYITSWQDTTVKSSDMARIWTAVVTTLIGFACQFLGLRACHSSVAVTQLGATVVMSLVRAGLRTQRLRTEDNLLADDPDFFQGHELDYLALKIGQPPGAPSGPKSHPADEILSRPVWMISSVRLAGTSDKESKTAGFPDTAARGGSVKLSVLDRLPTAAQSPPVLFGFRVKNLRAGNDPTLSDEELAAAAEQELAQWLSSQYCSKCELGCDPVSAHCTGDPNAVVKAMFYRARLARMTGLEEPAMEHSSYWGEQFVPIRETALALALAIEDTMRIFFASRSKPPVVLHPSWEQASCMFWTLKCSLADAQLRGGHSSHVHMSLRRDVDASGVPVGEWKTDRSEIEAVIGLWLWSLREPRSRQELDAGEGTGQRRSISRILLASPDLEHTSHETLDLDIWRERAGVKIQKLWLRLDRLITPGPTSYLTKVQNSVWLRHGEDFVASTRGYSSLHDNRDLRRFFGWHNVDISLGPLPTRLAILEIPSKSSLLLNCAQEIYSTFLAAILQAVDDIGGHSEAVQHQGTLAANNENVEAIRQVLLSQGLCDEEDAFACTIPVLQHQGKLKIPDETLSMAGKLADEYRSARKWKECDELISWRLHRTFNAVDQEYKHWDPADDATNRLRLSVLEVCDTYYRAIFQEDDDERTFGCQGIVELLKRYSRDEKVTSIPLVWTDCGTVPEDLDPSSRRLSLADTVRCYDEAVLWHMCRKNSLSGREQQLQGELRGFVEDREVSAGLFQAIQDADLGSTLYLVQREFLHEPRKTQALIRASQIGWPMVVKALVDRGAAVEEEDRDGRTALSYAAELGDINMVRMLIREGATLMNRGNHDYEDRRRPCHYAAKQGHATIVGDMARKWKGSGAMDWLDNERMTPLSWAITSGNAATVRALLGGGRLVADPNHYHTTKPALHWAIREGKDEIVDALLGFEDVDPNHNNSNAIDAPPLVCAVRLRKETIFDRLLSSERIRADTPDGRGRSALWWAAALGLDPYVQKLLDSGKIHRPDITDKRGETPLSIAVQAGHLGVVRQLLKLQPAATVSLRAMIIAAANGHVAVLKEFLPTRVKSKEQAKKLLEGLKIRDVYLARAWASILDTEFWLQRSDKLEIIQEASEEWKTTGLGDGDIEYASRLQAEKFDLLGNTSAAMSLDSGSSGADSPWEPDGGWETESASDSLDVA